MTKLQWKPLLTVTAAVLLAAGCQSAPTEAGEAGEVESGNSASSPANPPIRMTTLKPGTAVKVRTTNTLSTAAVNPGETFVASLEEPLVDGTWVLAAKGATVRGVVAGADPGGKVKGVASISLRLTELETAGGKTVDIATNTFAAQAKSSKKKDAKKIGIASGVGAAVGAIVGGGKGAAVGAGAGAGAGTAGVLMTRGEAAVIPSETVLTFKLTEPVTFQKSN